MSRPRHLVFDLRSPGRIRYYRDFVKLFLIAVGCLSVGLHIAVFSRSTFDTACSPDIAAVHVQHHAPGRVARLPQDQHVPAGYSSSESRKSSSDQLFPPPSAGGGTGDDNTGAARAVHEKRQLEGRRVILASRLHAKQDAPDVALNDAVGRQEGQSKHLKQQRKEYKSLWRYYRMTGNVSDSPYARPKQPISLHKTMRNAYISNGSDLDTSAIWDRFHAGIQPYQLYDDTRTIDDVIKDLQTAAIERAEMKDGGTQLKLFIEFEGEGKALFKPLRLNSTQEDNPNHFYFNYFERHYSEIAAYHLDRLLGFHRAPPVAGRLVNLITDIRNKADDNLRDTFYISPAGNICLTGSCKYYCDTSHGLCGSPETLPASFSGFLPEDDGPGLRMTWRHPWRRSYSRTKLAPWEMDSSYCNLIKTIEPYDGGRRMLDIMDMAVFDFLINNLDRHHYETFYEFGNESSPIHLDQGRSFNKASTDDQTILAPISQCCLIRRATLKRLLDLASGPQSISQLLDLSLKSDLLYPVLSQPHLDAVDRRLFGILDTLEKCLASYSTNPSRVIIQEDLKSFQPV